MTQRAAVTAFFALDGFAVSSFFARLPAIQNRLDLDPGEVGLALLALTAALLVAQPLAGGLAARWGSAPLVTVSAVAVGLAVAAPAFAGSLAVLALATAAIGFTTGALDVTMNVQGVAVERHLGRPILSGLHAAFSLGMLAGAGAAGAAAAQDAAPRAHLTAVAALTVLVALVAGRRLLPAGADAQPGGPAFARPSRVLAGLGAIAFCVLLAEGAVADWSAIHLADTLRASEGTAAVGLAAFSATMAAGRLAGDRLTDRIGMVAHTRGGGAIAAAGLLLAALAPSAAVAIAGFAIAGAGLSALFPLMVRAAAARGGERPGPAIAAVSTAGYGGLVTGPPLVGFLAEATSLPFALASVLGGLTILAVGLAPTVRGG